MKNAVLRMDRNEAGRDFVIGDVHGAYDLVLMAMAEANFDPKRESPGTSPDGRCSGRGA